jgi:hypothetical protein
VAWTPVLPLTGGTLTGPLTLYGPPAQAMEAANQGYVDNQISTVNPIGRFLPLTGGTVTGATTYTANLVGTSVMQGQAGLTAGSNGATIGAVLTVNGAAGNNRRVDYSTAGSLRWRMGANNTAEGGANAGSDFFINAYNDTGSVLATPFAINRATQQTQLLKTRVGGPGATSTYAGGAPDVSQATLYLNYNYTGSTNGSAWLYHNYMALLTDTVDVGANQQAIGLGVIHYYGGAGTTGGRTGFRYQMSQNGVCSGNGNYQAGLITSDASYSSGGTDLWSNASGVLFGTGIYAGLNSGATSWRGVSGLEIDYYIASGATAGAAIGIQVIRTSPHGFNPPVWEFDAGITVGSATTAAFGAKFGVMVGLGNGGWVINPTSGRIMGCGFTTGFSTTNPMQAAHGIDLYNVDLTGTAFRARGFSVLGSGGSLPAGAVQVGGGYLSSSGATVSLDAVGSVCTGATVATGGTNLVIGTPLIHDATGTLAIVATSVAGVAATVTLVPNTGFALSGAIPANPVTFRVSTAAILTQVGAPTAPTLNLTWNASTTLALNPSGGPVTVRGMPISVQQALYASYTNVGNGADITVDTLQTFTMAAGQLKNVGDRIIIRAGGTFAASTDNKIAQCRMGAAPLFSVTVSAAGQTSWRIEGEICKTGANAQASSGYAAATNNIMAASSGTQAQTDTGALVLSIVGQNTTNPVASSITCRYFTVDYIAA